MVEIDLERAELQGVGRSPVSTVLQSRRTTEVLDRGSTITVVPVSNQFADVGGKRDPVDARHIRPIRGRNRRIGLAQVTGRREGLPPNGIRCTPWRQPADIHPLGNFVRLAADESQIGQSFVTHGPAVEVVVRDKPALRAQRRVGEVMLDLVLTPSPVPDGDFVNVGFPFGIPSGPGTRSDGRPIDISQTVNENTAGDVLNRRRRRPGSHDLTIDMQTALDAVILENNMMPLRVARVEHGPRADHRHTPVRNTKHKPIAGH